MTDRQDRPARQAPSGSRREEKGGRGGQESPQPGAASAVRRSLCSGRVRCAIYTRKSSEEGLEQEFNSLDAQREACDAYVRSQKHEGWSVLPQLYDDPGFSGGNMERPALKRLLADIVARKVDVVVVYKVDRLTRSLADFAKIVEVFDANAVSFVSITQAFNTTTSMGRLTLNVLLSFAQFEREVTGERIRDKIAASKKKGLWMGRQPSLGYDVKDRKLSVNEAEAETVRMIFSRYLELGSVRELKASLDAEGVVSKLRTAADGSGYGGKSFSRGALYQMLQNRVYRGMIVHKGAAYPGEHPPIVDEDLWLEVQRKLEANGVERRTTREETKQAYLLAGVLFDAGGEPMTPTHAVKKGVRYRYYVSRHLIIGVRAERKRVHETGQRLPAAQLERLVIERLRTFFADSDAVMEALPSRHRDAPSVKRALAAAADIVRAIAAGGEEQSLDILRPLIARAQVHSNGIDVDLWANLVSQALLPGSDPVRKQADGPQNTSSGPDAFDFDRVIRLTITAALKRAGVEMKFVIDGADEGSTPDAGLVRLLIRAHSLARRVATRPGSNLEDVGAQEGMGAPYAARLMRLNYLAPDIVVAILSGRQPVGLTARKLMADTRLPLEWSQQRAALGFA
jgi:DNA invertase Pin-like site-specific DNA recombinase